VLHRLTATAELLVESATLTVVVEVKCAAINDVHTQKLVFYRNAVPILFDGIPALFDGMYVPTS